MYYFYIGTFRDRKSIPILSFDDPAVNFYNEHPERVLHLVKNIFDRHPFIPFQLVPVNGNFSQNFDLY